MVSPGKQEVKTGLFLRLPVEFYSPGFAEFQHKQSDVPLEWVVQIGKFLNETKTKLPRYQFVDSDNKKQVVELSKMEKYVDEGRVTG